VTTQAPVPVARLIDLPRYEPGRSSAAAMAEFGLQSAIKLASNESPFGALPGVSEAIAAAAAGVNRYPDHTCEEITVRYADFAGVDRSRVAVGPGSVGVLQQLLMAYAGTGEEVLFPWPSFSAYPQFTILVGGAEQTTPLVRQTIDVEAVIAAMTEHTRVVLIANPNNPTSTALRAPELTRLVEAAPPTCLIVIDEAYHEYATGADVPNAVELFADRQNVAVLRTLSKAYGLAGTRIGFAIAHPDVVDAVRACALPFGVSSVSQAAAIAALDQRDEVAARCTIVTDERTRVAQALRRAGLGVPDSQGNFWWLAAGDAAPPLASALERRGVVTRPLPGGVRVTIGTPDENDRFIEALVDVRVSGDVPDVTDDWGGATGDRAVQAAGWLDRLEAALARYRDHLDRRHPGRTEPVFGEDETWDASQVWSHVAEFGDYWLDQLGTVLDAQSDNPVPFGRTRRDPARIAAIAAGRHDEPARHLETIERSADRLRALLASMTDADWARTGKHETLGVMDLDAQLSHFHVGHYEEHADQLDLTAARP
jgi:histidinol-phosphate aminotransferase